MNSQRKEADDAKAQFIHPDGDHLTLVGQSSSFLLTIAQIQLYSSMFIMLTVQPIVSVHPCDIETPLNVALADPNWCWSNFLSHRALMQADNVRTQLKRTMERFEL